MLTGYFGNLTAFEEFVAQLNADYGTVAKKLAAERIVERRDVRSAMALVRRSPAVRI